MTHNEFCLKYPDTVGGWMIATKRVDSYSNGPELPKSNYTKEDVEELIKENKIPVISLVKLGDTLRSVIDFTNDGILIYKDIKKDFNDMLDLKKQ